MSRLDVNRFGEMEVFVRVVEEGGFSAAARACRMTPSAVSKLVARLEARLVARLVKPIHAALPTHARGHGVL
ncbi:LysR family transcriptional regulator [Ralstonia sp. GP101]|uniref:helix-turn-helix domain-containing protein n=1 Tax=unclassified Ralstonia TaxID=209769 RepID=UPI0038922E60